MKQITRLIFILFCAFALPYEIVGAEANPPDTLRFSHKKHVQDAGVECVDCHTNAPKNTSGGKTNHPKMANCKKCHEDAVDEKNCAMCHSNVKAAKDFKVKLYHKEFSHQNHLEREVQCLFCHKDVDKTTIATEKNLPSMKICWSCHNDKTAPRNCDMCHVDPEKKRPASHSAPWFANKGHGRDAKFAKLDCEKCHQETFCDKCHMGQQSQNVHPPDFGITHGFEARKADKNCTVCHETSQMCSRCHGGTQ